MPLASVFSSQSCGQVPVSPRLPNSVMPKRVPSFGDFVALAFMIGQVIPQLFACFFYEVKKTHSILLLIMKSE